MNTTPKRYTIICLIVLVCLCGLIQAVVVARSSLPSIDCVRFVAIAQQIDAVGFRETFWFEGQQPLFPLAVYATHALLSAACCGSEPSLWAASAQLTAAAALVFAVVPVYFISRRLAGPCGGFIGGVFFCVLPEVARLGADGISDSTHLLMFALAFWALIEYLQYRDENNTNVNDKHRVLLIPATITDIPRSENPANPPGTGALAARQVSLAASAIKGILLLSAAGLAAGLAVLTRVETIVLFPALLVAAFACLLFGHTRAAWKKMALAGIGTSLGAAVVIVPYVLAVGSVAPGDAVQRVLGRQPHSAEKPIAVAHMPERVHSTFHTAGNNGNSYSAIDGRQFTFGVKEPDRSIRCRGWSSAFVQFAEELGDAFGYVIGCLSILGLLHLWRMRRLRLQAVECLIAVFCSLMALAVLRFTAIEGYLTARHLMPLVVIGMGSSGIGAMALAHWLRQRRVRVYQLRPLPMVVFFFVAICLITTLRPLRANRVPHRLAGDWLAKAARPGKVLDTKGWTSLYSSRSTFQYDRAREAFTDPRLAYVVVQREDLQSQSERGRTLRFLLKTAGRQEITFGSFDNRSTVCVYYWDPQKFRREIVGSSESGSPVTFCQIRPKGKS